MINLDNLAEIKRIDTSNVLGSIKALGDQCIHAFEDASKVDVPESYRNIKNVIMTGMGGSGLGARIIDSVYHEEMRFPFTRINDYNLPAYADENSLVICSSYSGTTEEIVQTAREAIDKKTKWMTIGTGKTLIDLAIKHGVPYYEIDPRYNPSEQPRMAIGYSVIGQLMLAAKAGLFDLSKSDVSKSVSVMHKVVEKNNAKVPENENEAKKLARRLYGKNVFYIAARHLVGPLHTVNNQLNENAKVFSGDYAIPELNHHLMEGLKHPESNSDNIFIFFATSNLYPDRINKRFKITMDVVEKNKIEYYEYKTSAKTKLAQGFEAVQFGAFVNFYLSILYQQNPAPIPWVDYFKDHLK